MELLRFFKECPLRERTRGSDFSWGILGPHLNFRTLFCIGPLLLIFIGSLGDQADRLAKKLPSGKGFVCLDTKKIPEILKTIFMSTMLK